MSDTQTYCGHIFIIVVASGGTSGNRKLVMWSGVRAGRERERPERRGEERRDKSAPAPVQNLDKSSYGGLLQQTRVGLNKTTQIPALFLEVWNIFHTHFS